MTVVPCASSIWLLHPLRCSSSEELLRRNGRTDRRAQLDLLAVLLSVPSLSPVDFFSMLCSFRLSNNLAAQSFSALCEYDVSSSRTWVTRCESDPFIE